MLSGRPNGEQSRRVATVRSGTMRSMGAQTALTLLLAAIAVIVLVDWISERTRLPSATLLVLVGIGQALLPGPTIGLEPDVVMTASCRPCSITRRWNRRWSASAAICARWSDCRSSSCC